MTVSPKHDNHDQNNFHKVWDSTIRDKYQAAEAHTIIAIFVLCLQCDVKGLLTSRSPRQTAV